MTKIMKRIQKLKSGLRQWAYSNVMPWIDRIRATNAIRKLQKRKADTKQPIKVGFVVQMPEIWNKEAPVYEAMSRDLRFEPWLIVVPSYSMVTRQRSEYGEELEYFTTKYPEAKLLTTKELGADFDALPGQGFAYIFFQRCWEAYVPSSLRTRKVINYAKTCYIPYAFHCFLDSSDYYQTRFFFNLYIMFCCSNQQKETYRNTGRRKSEFLGFPVLAKLERTEPAVDAGLRILWTPRWTTDPQYGGTTFFDYKDKFIQFKHKHPEVQILFRPHPLTFEHAIQKNRMTPEDINQFKRRNEEAGIRFDENADVDKTLQSIDVMITDFTSVIIDAFLSGKILIYCGGKTDEKPSETLLQILKCSYRAETWEDVEAVLEKLRKGEDPMRDARRMLAEALIQEHRNSDKAILQFIADDYYQPQ